MKNSSISDIERTLRQSIDIPMTMDDLRIIVNCFRAVEYWSRTDGESYLDDEGRELMNKLEAKYLGGIEASRRWSLRSPMPAFMDDGR